MFNWSSKQCEIETPNLKKASLDNQIHKARDHDKENVNGHQVLRCMVTTNNKTLCFE